MYLQDSGVLSSWLKLCALKLVSGQDRKFRACDIFKNNPIYLFFFFITTVHNRTLKKIARTVGTVTMMGMEGSVVANGSAVISPVILVIESEITMGV